MGFDITVQNNVPTESEVFSLSFQNQDSSLIPSNTVPRSIENNNVEGQETIMPSVLALSTVDIEHELQNYNSDCNNSASFSASNYNYSYDKLTDTYANAAQQNYRLWLSSF